MNEFMLDKPLGIDIDRDSVISFQEAAAALKVTCRRLRRLVRSKLTPRPIVQDGKPIGWYRGEMLAWAMCEGPPLDVWEGRN